MSCSLSSVLLTAFIHVSICLENVSITAFGVQIPNIFHPGCGINYDTNTIYIVGGTFISGRNTPNYVTWNALDTTDWINIDNYNDIKSPSFQITQLNANVLKSIPEFSNNDGEWACYRCLAQINRNPYIYFVGPGIDNIPGRFETTSSMLIYDMNNNNYIDPIKYKYTIPNGSKDGLSCSIYQTRFIVIYFRII